MRNGYALEDVCDIKYGQSGNVTFRGYVLLMFINFAYDY